MTFVNPNLANLRNPGDNAKDAGEQSNRLNPHLSHVTAWLPIAFETFNLRVFGNCFPLFGCAEGMANNSALEKLKNVMNDAGKSVEELFAEMDADGDGTINGPEFYKGVKKLVGEALTPDQISMIIAAFDTNGDNRIDVMELRNALA